MGAGIGQGFRPEGPLGDHDFDRTKVKTELGQGEIIGSFFVRGVPPKGPSETRYVELLGQYQHEATQALEREPIPAGQRDQVRKYFDSLKPPPEGLPPSK